MARASVRGEVALSGAVAVVTPELLHAVVVTAYTMVLMAAFVLGYITQVLS